MKKLLSNGKIRNVLLAIVILLVVISIFFDWQMRAKLTESIKLQLEKDNVIIAKEIDNFISKYKTLVDVLKSNQMVLQYIRDVDSREVKRSHPFFEEVGILLNELQGMDTQIEHVWVGFNSINDYLIQDLSYEQNDPDYYYAERPWYIAMIGNGIDEVTVSPLYVSMIDQIYQVSLLAPVMPKGYVGTLSEDNIGQVGVDLNLRHITGYVANYRLGSTGYAIMVDEFGDYVVKPNGWSDKTNILDEEGELGVIASKLLFGESSIEIVNHQGVDYYIAYTKATEAPWYVLSYVTVDEVNDELYLFNMLLFLVILIMIIVVVIVVWLVKVQSSNKELLASNDDLIRKEEELKLANFEMDAAYQQLSAQEDALRSQFDEIQEYTKQLESQKNVIKHLAANDPLTEMPNRRSFIEQMEKALENDRPFAVFLLDLDNFKQLNDTMGHVYGDRLLIQIAEHLKTFVSNDIFISRFSGDEFLILYKNYGRESEVESFAKGLVDSFNERFKVHTDELFTSVSIGISLYPKHSESVDDLIMFADTAMYHVKENGKNNYIIFTSEMSKSLHRKKLIENTLRECILNHSFHLVYQPLYHASSEELVSAEALIRLDDSAFSPGEFIPVAEDTGLIIEIGRRTVKEVIRQQKEWQVKGYPLIPIAINFSAVQINDVGFIDELKTTLSEFELDPKWISIEITESVFLQNEKETLHLLNALHELGIKIALDDFGTGYSSISYLSFLPVDYLKIDKALTDQLKEDKEFIANIINLAHSLKLLAVAEGVEEIEQVKMLKDCGCDYIQGYYYSKPLINDEFSKLLNR